MNVAPASVPVISDEGSLYCRLERSEKKNLRFLIVFQYVIINFALSFEHFVSKI